MKKKILIITTVSFPYKGGESTWKDHLISLTEKFDQVIFYPLPTQNPIEYEIPKNVTILREKPTNYSFRTLVRYFRVIFFEIFRERKLKITIKNLRTLYSTVKYASKRAEILFERIKTLKQNDEVIFHSTWLNINALSLSFLKAEKKIPNFSFRINGFDFQDERQKSGHVFFRRYVFNQSDFLIGLSNYSIDYLIKKEYDKNKMILNYGGKFEKLFQPIDPHKKFTCVSCSSLIPLKRVTLIAKALKYLTVELNWIHFGDGPERQELESIINDLPANIQVTLYGHVDQNVIENFYEQNQVNLFLHMSESEGLCMSIIEAQRYGIPSMVCAVGGVKDIVNNFTGVLLSERISPEELSVQIENFRQSRLNSNEFRRNVQTYFKNHFEVEKNTIDFIKAHTSHIFN